MPVIRMQVVEYWFPGQGTSQVCKIHARVNANLGYGNTRPGQRKSRVWEYTRRAEAPSQVWEYTRRAGLASGIGIQATDGDLP